MVLLFGASTQALARMGYLDQPDLLFHVFIALFHRPATDESIPDSIRSGIFDRTAFGALIPIADYRIILPIVSLL